MEIFKDAMIFIIGFILGMLFVFMNGGNKIDDWRKHKRIRKIKNKHIHRKHDTNAKNNR